MREAPAITIVNRLLRRAAVQAYDPEAERVARGILAPSGARRQELRR
jgi:UDP-glucose 6-dehydrogenase